MIMAEIKCPKCGTRIQLDKSEYDALLSEIKEDEINKRVEAQEKLIEDKYKAQYEKRINDAASKKDLDISDLKHQIDKLEQQLKNTNNEKEAAIAKAIQKEKDVISEKNVEIARLEGDLKNAKSDSEVKLQEIKNVHALELEAKDKEIEQWKNFRVGDSTKDIGESLEQYCKDAFESIRSNSYPFAYFEKDNQVVEGTKGDFVFRDYSDETKEHEIISIMFEMKNQKEDGKTKNEDHFKKLDSDRKKKNCEYAVLVSTLEPDRELYNKGPLQIHGYNKMYVVRPQNFLMIISVLKDMAKTRFIDRKEVILYQKQNVDITGFENAVRAVARVINDDYEKAGKQYDSVVKMCDDMINKLNDLKETFRLGRKWIGAAQSHLPELEIRKLTKNNPTMKAKFEALDGEAKEEDHKYGDSIDGFLEDMTK